MATYYVRISGNDSNAGTSAGTAWRTLNKAFTTVVAGDQVWIGAGTYREALTISTAWASETKFSGDYTGEHTGDAGIIYWSAYTNGDRARGGIRPLTTSGTPRYWTFENLVFAGGTSGGVFTLTPRNFIFRRCAFLPTSRSIANASTITATVDLAADVTFDGCYIAVPVTVTLPTSASADYDVNTVFTNCLLNGGYILVLASGANAFYGGGVDSLNCTFLYSYSIPFRVGSSGVSTSIPCTVYNSLLIALNHTGLQAATSGQITEDYNCIFANTPRSNVSAGVNTISDFAFAARFSGFEWLFGLSALPQGMPLFGSPFGYMGGASAPSTDILGRTRTGNGAQWIDDGTATSGGANTLTDSGAAWNTNDLIGALLLITSGTGSGQRKLIKSNTATEITAFENWQTNPDNTSVYRIIRGPNFFTGIATLGASTSLTVSSATWDANQWAGYTIEITAGTGSGQTRTITSNTGTVLTVPTWTTNPDATSVFSVYRQTGVDALLPSVGCFEPYTVQREQTVVESPSTSSYGLCGPGYIEFQYPVEAASTTITYRGRYDARHGTTNKPQLQIVDGGECGVSDATVTMSAGVDTWGDLSTTFTPTAVGIVTVRLISRADYPDGRAFFQAP